MPRQSRKTTVMLTAGVDRCLYWRGIEDDLVQQCGYTAQNGAKGREKFVEEIIPNYFSPPPAGMIADHFTKTLQGAANTAIYFRNGRVYVGTSSDADGHGPTTHLGMIDEAWKDVDNRREGGFRPSMITKDTAQLIVASTAGTAASAYWNRKVSAARAAAEADKGSGTAYIEYSAPPDADPYNEDVWWDCHPALGLSQSIVALRSEAEDLPTHEFKRAYLNIPTDFVRDQKIPADSWQRACGPHSALDQTGTLQWAFDVSADRNHAAIVVATHTDTHIVCELVDYNPDPTGVAWVKPRITDLADRYGGTIVYDNAGPGATIGHDIDTAVAVGGSDMLAACDALLLGLASNRVLVRTAPQFDHAVRSSPTRTVGDRWAWTRTGATADSAPLIALTLAAAPDIEPPETVTDWVL